MVAIKDFKMPKNCWDCPIFYDYLHCPLVDKKNEGGLNKHRASNCPLIEIEEPKTEKNVLISRVIKILRVYSRCGLVTPRIIAEMEHDIKLIK